MMSRFFYTVRWRFMYAFLASIVLSVAVLFVCYRIVQLLVYTNPASAASSYTAVLRWLINHIGSIPIMSVVGIGLFLLFFFLFSRKVIDYLEEITAGLQEISRGNLAHSIEVKTMDELGDVARHINDMTAKLTQSIAEERKAEQAKNDLITGVSHDLRTPLTSILGFLEYIDKDRYQDEVELRHYVSIAYDKSLSLKKLIDDLFEYTRINSSGLPLQFTELNMNHFMKQLAEEFAPQLEQAGMTYEIEECESRLLISADPAELVRAYDNLLSNAIRYGSDGGRVTIRLLKEQDRAVIKVVNYGKPIPERDLPHIFERFYREEKSRSRHTGGSGLGLAITRSIVELHRGSITVDSNRKQTEFVTSYPLLAVD